MAVFFDVAILLCDKSQKYHSSENVILLLIHENKFKLFLLQLDKFNSDTIYNYIENNNMNIIGYLMRKT